jgi:protein-tyrosine phosphatase
MNFAVPYARTRWDEIVPGLFQGGHDYDELRKMSSVCPVIVTDEFDLVVSLFKRWGHGPDDGVEERRAQIPDGELNDEDMAKVTALVPRVVDALKENKKVLVRCQAGYNRSGLVVALVLLRLGYTADDAIALIREKRSEHALCNELFVEYIHDAAKGGAQ